MEASNTNNYTSAPVEGKDLYAPPRLIPLGDIDEFATAYDVSVRVP